MKGLIEYIHNNAECIRRIGRAKIPEFGFNAFALMSDHYKRENYHSDIIAALLDPHERHDGGVVFLRKFIDYVTSVAEQRGNVEVANNLKHLIVDNNAEVVREESKIDILIKGVNGLIVIENKINGAGDMPRQIPRYVEYCQKTYPNLSVAAIVYIKPSDFLSMPDTATWEVGDAGLVGNRIVTVAGYNETKDVPNLVEGWLDKCENAASTFAAKAVISQYKEVVKVQAGETMNQVEFERIIGEMDKSRVSYTALCQSLNELPKALADMTVCRFSRRSDLYVNKVCTWKDVCVAFRLSLDVIFKGEEYLYGIDLWCDSGELWMYARSASCEYIDISSVLGVVKKYNERFSAKEGSLCLNFDKDEMFRLDFLAKISALLEFLKKHKDDLTKIKTCKI